MAAKLLNLAAVASLALLACSFGPAPANAVSLDMSPNHARSFGHHQLIAKKKRSTTGRCKVRPTSSSVAVVSTSTTKPVSTTTKAAATTSTKKTSTKAAATPTASAVAISGSNGNGKAGLAWINPSSVSLKPFVTEKTGRIYSWSPWKPDAAAAAGLGDLFVPMLWGPSQAADFQRLVVAGYANAALGPNEPDLSGQANLSPSTVVGMWWQYMQPLVSKGYRLGTPAVTSGSSGKPWLKEFISSCSGCTIDFVALHWYGTDAQAFIAYVEDFHTTFGKPIWVTEFACQDFSGGAQADLAQINTFMNTVTSWMDSTSYVEQYFAFGFMQDMGNVNPLDTMLTSSNTPNALGSSYLH